MDKHTAIIKGNIIRKKYEYDYYQERIRTKYETIQRKTLWHGKINTPLLNSGERLHVTELDLTVTIEECVRTTENDYIYFTNHIIEIKEDETSKEKAIKDKKKYEREEEEEKKEGWKKWEEYNKKPWYKRLFEKE